MKSNKKVLIAEDELLIARVLRMQLEKCGFEVENVMDADSAFNAVKTNATQRYHFGCVFKK